jgi:predicted flap endonuclease-1-like 5' DNA nuclease
MTHYLIELALWVLGFYFLGCLVGWILRNLFGRAEQPVAEPEKIVARPVPAYVPPPAPAPTPMPAAAPVRVAAPPPPAPVAPRPIVAPVPMAAPVPRAAPTPVAAPTPMATGKMERPKGLSAARGGKADDLQRVSGIGPKNEAILHNLGFFHFDQIAEWTATQVEWVDDHLRFGGRIKREEWIKQARLLAAGKDDEFAKQYGTGGLRNAKGQTFSGTRTRK